MRRFTGPRRAGVTGLPWRWSEGKGRRRKRTCQLLQLLTALAASLLIVNSAFAQNPGSDRAGQRIAEQSEVSALNTRLQRERPDTFAGLWIEKSPELRVVVRFTGDAKGQLAAFTKDPRYVAETAPRSLELLLATEQEMIHQLNAAGIFRSRLGHAPWHCSPLRSTGYSSRLPALPASYWQPGWLIRGTSGHAADRPTWVDAGWRVETSFRSGGCAVLGRHCEVQTKSPDQGRGFLRKLVPEIGVKPTTSALRTQPTDSGERSKRQATDCISRLPPSGPAWTVASGTLYGARLASSQGAVRNLPELAD